MHGTRIRRRSVETIIEEIEYLMKAHGVGEIHIEDDNFTFSKDHVVNLCTAIRQKKMNLFFTLPNGVRLDKLDDEILRELEATGFYTFSIGIESGSPETLRRMGKALDLRIVRETITRIRKHGFQLKGYFMIGYPGETEKNIRETIRYATSLDLDRAYFTMFMPLPGTKDFQMLEERGEIRLEDIQWQNFYTKGDTTPPFVPTGMTADRLHALAHVAYRKFYARPRIVLKLVKDRKVTSFRQFVEVAWHLLRRDLSYFI